MTSYNDTKLNLIFMADDGVVNIGLCSNIIHYQFYSLHLSCSIITHMTYRVLRNEIQASQNLFT